eukprot:TRINITY_DN16225_c0_g1_i1.p1 TRINITY_DN16225_c0_g1~~TRINITY_DN16225_c0_g1_i1.p1  ORF type:complete len:260 (-),score=59.72 TRINITY_DN16225_c0_g1_i1:88-867(-)
MGCDGGSIPTRCELVKQKAKPEQKDPNEINRIKWFSCAISKEPLKTPIVACELGNLYNKEAIISCLLNKNLGPFNHIRSLKDVFEVVFTPNPFLEKNPDASPYICPSSLLEVGGKYRFSSIRSCGCVVSQRALREINSKDCLSCGKPYNPKDVVPLNNSEEEVEKLKSDLEERQLAQKKTQKEKGVHKKDETKEKKRKKDKSKTTSQQKQVKKSKITSTTEKTKESAEVDLVYASIFTSSLPKNEAVQENFLCRNVVRA